LASSRPEASGSGSPTSPNRYDTTRRDAPPGRAFTRDAPTIARTLAFRGFPSLVPRAWRIVHDVNEASLYPLVE